MLSHIWRASRSTLVSFVFFSCFLLALNAQVQDNAAAVFKFSDVDRQVLDQSNAIDAQYVKKGLLLQDPDLQAYLDSVGKRVLGNRPIPEQVQFKFRVLRDPMVQAFALPNGSVYVTTGLLSLLENEAQLAGVLGHETAHVFERHGYFENRSVRKKALTLNVIQIVASAAPVGPNFSQSVQLFGQAVQLGAAIGSEILVASIFGYSREMERQADSDGLQAMTEASYGGLCRHRGRSEQPPRANRSEPRHPTDHYLSR